MGKKKKKSQKSSLSEGNLVVAVNKKARRDYEILDVFEAGLSLLGTEVKSIRNGGANLKESYVRLRNLEAFLTGCHISPYSHARMDEYDPTRERKLLFHKKEIEKFHSSVQQKGFTLVPLRMYFKRGRCKLEVGLGRGKKLYDKREDLKTKEAKRAIERAMKM